MTLERLTIKVPVQLKRRLKQVCLDLDLTMQDFIAPLIELEVERVETEIEAARLGEKVSRLECGGS